MPAKREMWASLEDIPGRSKKRRETENSSDKKGVDNMENGYSESHLPLIVAKATSIAENIPTGIVSEDVKTNKIRPPENNIAKAKIIDASYEEVFQGIIRRKMKDSWLNTNYQRAIWNARRRLMRGEILEDLPEAERNIISPMVSPRVKPDYSKWAYSKKNYPHGLRLSRIPNDGTASSRRKYMDDMKGARPEQALSLYGGGDISGNFNTNGLHVYPMEFVSLSDRLTLHEPPWLEALRKRTETEENDLFWMCYGCFHNKGPHYHYQAPVRTGGGFTIYDPRHVFQDGSRLSYVKPDTLKWINQDHRVSEEGSAVVSYDAHNVALGDDFTTRLFHQFLENGGDPSALKEYLESNFDPEVLKDLEEAGANVQLIKEYAELMRQHIRETLAKDLQKQEDIVKVGDREMRLIKRFIEVTSAGGDLEMLLVLLTEGKKSAKIQEYEKQGGNIELHDHYASKLLDEFAGITESQTEMEGEAELSSDQQKQKEDVIKRLRNYIENDLDHKHAYMLLEYMSRGGRLDVLVEYVGRGASSPGILTFEKNGGDLSLVRQYAEEFPNKAMLIRDIDKFVRDHFRNYTSAKLLQKYIENGGKVKVLKEYVRNGCTFSPNSIQRYIQEGGNVRLLQDIGQEFASDRVIGEDLQQFPDNPKVLEAYIRRGGSFPRLVRAIADALGKPLLEAYVKKKADSVKIAKKGATNQDTSGTKLHSEPGIFHQTSINPPPSSPDNTDARQARSISPTDPHTMLDSPNSMTKNLLPALLETARAELKYDELVATEEKWSQNEGAFLAKAVDANQDMLPVTSVALTKREKQRIPYSIFHSSDSKESATVSLITGEKRPRLWKAPPPFTIKKSEADPTFPRSPFSEDREYDISSLSENHILGVEKRQRHELDVLRRNYNSKDFRENWKVSIHSPDGSVISQQDSTIEAEFEKTKPVALVRAKPEKKDKLSRRERQRAKMKAAKSKPSKTLGPGRNSPVERRKSDASTASTLSLPDVTNTEAMVSYPKKVVDNLPNGADTKTDTVESKERSVKSIANSIRRSQPNSITRASTSASASNKEKGADLTIGIQSVKMLDSTDSSPVEAVDSEKREDEEEEVQEADSSDDDEVVKQIAKPAKHVVPPLPNLTDIKTEEEEVESPFPTAFGKTPRTQKPKETVDRKMIENPETQMSEKKIRVPIDDFKVKMAPRIKRRVPLPRPPLDARKTLENMLGTEDASGVENVLKKYCIIREERLPRYRLIFDKHLMLRQMRLHERAAKAKRANKMLIEEDYGISLDDASGPEHDELKKLEFLFQLLSEKIDDVEHEIKVAQGCLDRSKALTGREMLFKNKKLLSSPRRKRTTRSRGSFNRKSIEVNEDFQDGNEVMENMETAMGSDETNKGYDYNQSARSGFESRNESSPRRAEVRDQTSNKRIPSPVEQNLPLQELSDAQVMNKLDAKTKRLIERDEVVRHNAAAVSALQDKLKRMKRRQDILKERLEKQKVAAEKEKHSIDLKKQRNELFIRQQSSVYQALHPADDPVLAIDDVPEALRDINGEITGEDGELILEALDFPRRGEGVNFRVFCILAALSESAVSIQPLVKRLARTRDARALNVKMDRCKEIYGSLLGPNLEILESELRSSGFTNAQYNQVIKKLTRDENGLSFLNFVTYVPLFLDIHKRIVSNPLTV